MIPHFAHYDFDNLELIQIEKWKRERLQGVSEATVKRQLDTLSNIFRVAHVTPTTYHSRVWADGSFSFSRTTQLTWP
jgi:hypothetical protein